MSTGMPRMAGALVLALLTGAATGGLVVFAVAHPVVPPSLASPPAATEIPVTVQSFTDPRPAEVVVTSAGPLTMRAPRGGLVTRFECAVGEPWRSGTRPVALDGAGLLALFTPAPLWRELAAGAEGADVTAVKKELARLGVEPSQGRRLTAGDLRALSRLAADVGARVDPTVLSPADVVWLPRRSAVPTACAVGLGERLEEGRALATAPGEIVVQVAAGELLPGERRLKVDEAELALADDLTPLDRDAGARVVGTVSYRSAAGDAAEPGAPVSFSAVVELVDAIDVAAVPPSAVHVASSTEGCVRTAEGVRSVILASSELGRALVVFDSGSVPPAVSLRAPISCG